jgi:hypothetical protein
LVVDLIDLLLQECFDYGYCNNLVGDYVGSVECSLESNYFEASKIRASPCYEPQYPSARI